MENQNQQTQTPPQAPEVSTQILSVNNNSNKSKVIVVILGVLVISIIGVGALVLIINQNQTINQQPITASPTIPQLTPTPLPTSPQIAIQQKSSDVLIYRASSWSIGYPQGYNIQKDSKTGGIFFFEPQNKAFMSVLSVKLSEEELKKVSSKEKLKEFMLQTYSITGITYLGEESSQLNGRNESGVSMRLVTKQKDFEGISDILLSKDIIYTIDFFVKTTLPNEEKKSLRSYYNEKILSTFVGE